MTTLGTYFRDMVECIAARLLCSSSAYGTCLLGLLYFGPMSGPFFSNAAATQLIPMALPLTSIITLVALKTIFRARRTDLTRSWRWFVGCGMAAASLALFIATPSMELLANLAALVAWTLAPLCLLTLMRRYALLALRRRIAATAASAVCSATGLLILSMLDAPATFLVIAALFIIATACLPDPTKRTDVRAASPSAAAKPIRYAPSFLITIMLYGFLGVLAQNSGEPHAYLGGQPALAAAFSIACIVILSLLKGRKGFVEDSNSAYKPAPLLMAAGLAAIAWFPSHRAPIGAALVAAGFGVFFVYYWIVIGNHIQKFSWRSTDATSRALVPLFAGMACGRMSASLMATFSSDPRQSIVILGLLMLVAVLWMVTQGDLFANEPGQDASVFKLQPPQPAPRAEAADAALETFARRFGISKREQDVVLLLSKGRNVPFICDELFIAKSTVQTHIKHIYAKTGATNRQELLDIIECENTD